MPVIVDPKVRVNVTKVLEPPVVRFEYVVNNGPVGESKRTSTCEVASIFALDSLKLMPFPPGPLKLENPPKMKLSNLIQLLFVANPTF